MSFLTVAKTILAIVPVITEVVQSVEVVSQGGSGSAKKALALAVVRTIYEASSPAVPFDTLVSQISGIVDALVAFYNTTGAFVKAFKEAA